MDSSFNPSAWHDFAIAVAGASAALAGLLFVAMSINVREILSEASLPSRAAGAIVTLVTPLIFSIFLLVPASSKNVLGIELIGVGVVAGVALARLLGPHESDGRSASAWLFGTALPATLLAGATTLAGVGILTTAIGGLSWLVVAVIAAIFGGLLQAWVLLIEILR